MNQRPLILSALVFALGLSACSHSPLARTGIKGTHQPEASQAALEQALMTADRASAAGLKTSEDHQAYSAATEKAVALWLALSDEKTRSKSIAAGGIYRMQATWPAKLLFDELIPARTIKHRTLKRHITREGVGVPFVAHWKPTAERQAVEPFMREPGYMVPVTATLEFRSAGQGVRIAALVLHDPRVAETVRLAGKSRPLAADLSAISEYIMSNKQLQMSKLSALLHAGGSMDKLGIIALERPSPDRIPAIFVHGLMSRPATWRNLLNELGADTELQKKYQVYFFRYPSGVPIIFSAAKLRGQLAVLHSELEKRGSHIHGHQMLLVGHSMGGLVSKSQVQGSGDQLWVKVFGATPDKLGLSKDEIDAMNRFLNFEPNPYVSRVIFMATPHRGSEIASGTLGKIGRKLISLPKNALGGAFLALKSHTQSPAIRKLVAKGVPSSVENLSPESPYVKIAMTLPLRPGLHIHSIIGNKDGLPLTDPRCTDGFVPYHSSHLNGVESELIVRSDHHVHDTPEALAEIKRIVRLHPKSF